MSSTICHRTPLVLGDYCAASRRRVGLFKVLVDLGPSQRRRARRVQVLDRLGLADCLLLQSRYCLGMLVWTKRLALGFLYVQSGAQYRSIFGVGAHLLMVVKLGKSLGGDQIL